MVEPDFRSILLRQMANTNFSVENVEVFQLNARQFADFLVPFGFFRFFLRSMGGRGSRRGRWGLHRLNIRLDFRSDDVDKPDNISSEQFSPSQMDFENLNGGQRFSPA